MDTPTLSIVVPVYNEDTVLLKAIEHIKRVMAEADIDYDVIFVDDGSTDDTWLQIESLTKEDTRIVGIKLSRNFGKESAILAGLQNSTGDACVVMDCDLQHPPEILPEMYEIWKKSNGSVDVVEGVKQSRGKESAIYRGFANLFYFLTERMGGIKLSNLSDFQLMDRRVVSIITNLPERQRFFRGLSSWVGFNREQVLFSVRQRESGKSKFNFFSSFKYAMKNMTSFSSVPLQVVTITGIIFFIASLFLGVHTLVNWITGGAVEGFTTVILLLLVIGAMIMLSLGIIGYYIGKIYEEIKCRPPYLIDALVNSKKDMQQDTTFKK